METLFLNFTLVSQKEKKKHESSHKKQFFLVSQKKNVSKVKKNK